MKTGKITNSVISRSVLKNIKPAKNSLAVKPSIGADASVLENGIVIASDSGFEPVYTASNNIYARGGRPQYIQCCVNLAQDMREIRLKEIMQKISADCAQLGLVVSGGHTNLVYVEDYTKFKMIAKTRDDAVGEAFDKVARVLGLPYPGGPEVSKLASSGKNTYKLPKTKFDNYDFSFSGIKTAVINLAHKEGENLRKEDLACSFETTVCEELVDTTITVMKDMNLKEVVLAGGVSANSYLRKLLKQEADENNFKVYMPELKYCTDNAAMVGVAASYNYEAGKYYNIKDKMDLNAVANLKIDM